MPESLQYSILGLFPAHVDSLEACTSVDEFNEWQKDLAGRTAVVFPASQRMIHWLQVIKEQTESLRPDEILSAADIEELREAIKADTEFLDDDDPLSVWSVDKGDNANDLIMLTDNDIKRQSLTKRFQDHTQRAETLSQCTGRGLSMRSVVPNLPIELNQPCDEWVKQMSRSRSITYPSRWYRPVDLAYSGLWNRKISENVDAVWEAVVSAQMESEIDMDRALRRYFRRVTERSVKRWSMWALERDGR